MRMVVTEEKGGEVNNRDSYIAPAVLDIYFDKMIPQSRSQQS